MFRWCVAALSALSGAAGGCLLSCSGQLVSACSEERLGSGQQQQQQCVVRGWSSSAAGVGAWSTSTTVSLSFCNMPSTLAAESRRIPTSFDQSRQSTIDSL